MKSIHMLHYRENNIQKSHLVSALIATLLLIFAYSVGDSKSISDAQLKAAFVYNFTKFVEWPSDSFSNANSPITIGVLGDENLGNTLSETVKDKSIGGRKITIKQSTKTRDMAGCNIVYIGSNNESRLGKVLEDVANRHVLTVSDIDGFARRGGIIGLDYSSGTVAFEINLKKAKETDLKISSKLLKLAHIIDG